MIVVVGLSHRSAPIEVRERVAVSKDAVPVLLGELAEAPCVGEVFVVSTCNRVEVVMAAPRGGSVAASDIAETARHHLEQRAPGVGAHLYDYSGDEAVRHLFRVAASLDSLVLGEPQILGQVKEAFDLAREVGTLGPALHRVVPRALRVAKRVRTETSVGAGQVSVPSVAVDLARQIFGDLSRHTAALIGSGEMGETVARLLRQAGSKLVVVGRNTARVQQIAGEMGGVPRGMEALEQTLIEADVIVTTTSAPSTIIDRSHLQRTRRARRGRSLFFIDLAVPRDVDVGVEDLDGVFLYNVDDLSGVVAESLRSRQAEAEKAEGIVAEEVRGFGRWVDAEQATPVIVALRQRFREVLEGELDRSLRGKLKHLEDADRAALAKMLDAAVNKLLHAPSVELRRLASDGGADEDLMQQTAALRQLFELEALRSRSAADAAEDEEAERSAAATGRARAPGAALGESETRHGVS